MQKEQKQDYECPTIRVVVGEPFMTDTTFSGQHKPGSNNGVVDGAKGNSFIFEEEEESN
jgi:hypothetical protein